MRPSNCARYCVGIDGANGNPAGIGQQREIARREIDVSDWRRKDTHFDHHVPAAVQVRRKDFFDVGPGDYCGPNGYAGSRLMRGIVSHSGSRPDSRRACKKHCSKRSNQSQCPHSERRSHASYFTYFQE
jgi:hypothetical protein